MYLTGLSVLENGQQQQLFPFATRPSPPKPLTTRVSTTPLPLVEALSQCFFFCFYVSEPYLVYGELLLFFLDRPFQCTVLGAAYCPGPCILNPTRNIKLL